MRPLQSFSAHYKHAASNLIQWPIDQQDWKTIKQSAYDLFFFGIFGPLFRLLCTLTLPISALLFAYILKDNEKRERAAAIKRREAYKNAYGCYPKYPNDLPDADDIPTTKCGPADGIYG